MIEKQPPHTFFGGRGHGPNSLVGVLRVLYCTTPATEDSCCSTWPIQMRRLWPWGINLRNTMSLDYMLFSCAAFLTVANYKCVRTRTMLFVWAHVITCRATWFQMLQCSNDISTQQIGISGLASTQWCWARDHSRLLIPHQRKAYPFSSSTAPDIDILERNGVVITDQTKFLFFGSLQLKMKQMIYMDSLGHIYLLQRY